MIMAAGDEAAASTVTVSLNNKDDKPRRRRLPQGGEPPPVPPVGDADALPRRLLPHQPGPQRAGPAVAHAHHGQRRRQLLHGGGHGHGAAGPCPGALASLRRLPAALVAGAARPPRPRRSLRRPLPAPLPRRARRVPPPRRHELPLRPLDLLPPAPAVGALSAARRAALPPALVGLLAAHPGAGRQDLRTVVHPGPQVPLHGSQPGQPHHRFTVIGNLVTARAAAKMGWHEGAVAIFAIGAAHYLVLFVTLYQRFLGSDSLPAMLRPVFFLFFAAPSMASLAWNAISSSFDTCCKMLFFLSLFLFASLGNKAKFSGSYK
ncbi:hypothetical protein PVAP13_5KG002900 [Panicum virgatum]|uniref:Uncharacterized protein n=1 Tax=Panicum virgatum TaxID=38727 RepID=A0A8T0S8U6_PANVG|nr:hypothetical protein PVAP13_5KG002900 [Panicum virgatum]